MTISKECELLAGDYLFLRDKLKQFQEDSLRMSNEEQIRSLGHQFLLTYLGQPGSDIIYPRISRQTLRSVEEQVRMALDWPTLDMIREDLASPVAKVEEEMWLKVVACECQGR